jgi:hypothetical protein
VLIVQPTRNLIDKTVNEEIQALSNPPSVKIFHKGTAGKNVAKSLADYASRVPDEVKEIAITTHAALPYIKHFENKDKWHLIIDEEMQVVRYQQHQIPRMHYLISDHVEVTRVNSIYGQIEVVDDGAMREIARNEDDDEILETLSDTCRILRNEHWDTFVNMEQYERLRRGEGHVLAFHSVLKPEILDGFASVFMTSANFEDSQVFKVWGSLGVEFKPDPEFARGLRYSEHPNGEAVTIYYVTDHQWSRYRRNKALEDGTTISDHMIQAAKKLFPSGGFLWHANKSIDEDPFGLPAQRLPNKPHGLNTFMNFDDVVFLSSLNPPPDHFRFLKEQYGISGDEVRGFTYLASAYQAIMRTSIRDPESRTPKRILGPDLFVAEYLHDVFPGSKIEKLDIGVADDAPKKCGRPRKHKSNRERVAAQRQKAKEEKLRLLESQWQLKSPDTDEINWDIEEEKGGGRSCANTAIRLYSNLSTQPMTATFYSCKKSPIPEAYASGDIPAFVDYLRNRHEDRPKFKEETSLFSPAIFDPKLPTGGKRRNGNIVYLRHVVLDFENGELLPEELPKLFSDLQMVVTNTFRHTGDKPRFRAILFTSENMTPEVYALIYGLIADKLEEAGYSVDRYGKKRKHSGQSNTRPSGLDWKKGAPTSLFWLPSQAEKSEDSFFNEFLEGRHPLNPSTWIEHSAITLQPIFDAPAPSSQTPNINWDVVESAKRTWRTSPQHPGKGNAMFFELAMSLKRAGMAFAEIGTALRSEAPYGRTPQERLAQIPSIMASLRVYATSWRETTLALEEPVA